MMCRGSPPVAACSSSTSGCGTGAPATATRGGLFPPAPAGPGGSGIGALVRIRATQWDSERLCSWRSSRSVARDHHRGAAGPDREADRRKPGSRGRTTAGCPGRAGSAGRWRAARGRGLRGTVACPTRQSGPGLVASRSEPGARRLHQPVDLGGPDRVETLAGGVDGRGAQPVRHRRQRRPFGGGEAAAARNDRAASAGHLPISATRRVLPTPAPPRITTRPGLAGRGRVPQAVYGVQFPGSSRPGPGCRCRGGRMADVGHARLRSARPSAVRSCRITSRVDWSGVTPSSCSSSVAHRW